jgi:hypothetical protein
MGSEELNRQKWDFVQCVDFQWILAQVLQVLVINRILFRLEAEEIQHELIVHDQGLVTSDSFDAW